MSNGDMFKSAFKGAIYPETSTLAELLDVPWPTSEGFVNQDDVQKLWDELSYRGSNDIAYAFRGFEGVDYPEIVRDVARAVKAESSRIADGTSVQAVERNERVIVEVLFKGIWSKLTSEEQEEILRGMDMDEGRPRVSGAAAAVAIGAGNAAGFLAYQYAVIVANFVARALLGKGLTFGANQIITKGLAAALGPIGWIASGAWLLSDLTSPATRKTIPAVIQTAVLRQLAEARAIIGVLGHGSAGKDSALRQIFSIDTNEISPIPGSTDTVRPYPVPNGRGARVLNFPGLGDLRPSVEAQVRQQVQHCKVMIYIFNCKEIPQNEQLQAFQDLAREHREAGSLIVLFNKMDACDPDEREAIIREAKRRTGVEDPILTCLKPGRNDALLGAGVEEARRRVDEILRRQDRQTVFR